VVVLKAASGYTRVPHHTSGISLKLFCIHPWPNTHDILLACLAHGVGQCLLPLASNVVICVAALSRLPNGLGTVRSYNRKTLSGLEPSFMCGLLLSFFPIAPCVRVYYTCPRARGACPRGRQHLYLSTWPTLNSFLFLRGTSRTWAAGNFSSGCWAVRLQVWHPWLVFKTSLIFWAAVTWGACFISRCPKSVQISEFGTKPSDTLRVHSFLQNLQLSQNS
jgi:hypothetical protein